LIKQQPFKLDGRKELGKWEMSKEVVVTLMDMGTLALFALISVEVVGILNKKEKKMKKKGEIKAKVLVVLGACIVTIFSVTTVAGMGALPQPVLNLGVITAGFDLGTYNQTTQPVQLLPKEVVGKGFYVTLSCAIKDTIRRGAVLLKTRDIINLKAIKIWINTVM